MAGGFLVATALVGTWSASTRGEGPPRGRVVVAARPIAAGARLRPGDLETVAADLPHVMRAHAFNELSALHGTVATGPLAAGDVVQPSHVARATARSDERELALAVDAAGSAVGALEIGDRVDVLVTYGEGTSSETRRVLAGAAVVRLAGRDGLGGEAGQTVTVGVRGVRRLLAAANAARAGRITLARATGAHREATGTGKAEGERYRPVEKGS